MGKVVVVLISEIQKDFFVRTCLNDDHVLLLAGLIEDGKELPPIKITPDYKLIDGRHRIEAHELNGIKEIEAEIVDITDQTELIATAYQANLGGSLPPTKEDTEHTIQMLLEKGVSKKKIRDLLTLPTGLATKFVDNVQSKMRRQKIQAALDAMTSGGLNVPQAAEKYDLDVETLREAINGRRKDQKTGSGVVEMKRALTSRYRSVGTSNGHDLSALLKLVQDADVSPKQALKLLKHLEKLQKQGAKKVEDWKARFEAAFPKE